MESTIMHEHLTIYSGSPIIARFFDYEKFTYPWHIHNEFEIIYVRNGYGERFVADNMESFHNHDVTIVGHCIPHYMKSAPEYEKGDTSMRVNGVIIQFEEDFMSHAINNYADLSHIKNLLEDSKRGVNFPFPESVEIISSIEQLPNSKGTMRIINLLHLLDLMANFKNKRYLGSMHFCQTISLQKSPRMEKIITFITNHYKEQIDLNEISSIAAMSASSFCRFFKEKSGKTLTEFILDLRIGYACKLLIEDKLDIVQICLESGFNSITHFNRIFKRKTGVTPTEYKKQFLK